MNIKRFGLIPSILLISLFLLSCGDGDSIEKRLDSIGKKLIGNSLEKKLIGEWYGKDTFSGKGGTIILKKDNTFQVIITNTFGNVRTFPPSTEELEQDNMVLENTSWKVNESEGLTKLLLLATLTNTESGKIQSIDFGFNFKFLDENIIKVDEDDLVLTRQ